MTPVFDILNELANNMNMEASTLRERAFFSPAPGKKYHFNLRANILKDFASVIQKTISHFEEQEVGDECRTRRFNKPA